MEDEIGVGSLQLDDDLFSSWDSGFNFGAQETPTFSPDLMMANLQAIWGVFWKVYGITQVQLILKLGLGTHHQPNLTIPTISWVISTAV